VLVELNSIESADNRCRLNFVVQNKSRVAIESMKIELEGWERDRDVPEPPEDGAVAPPA